MGGVLYGDGVAEEADNACAPAGPVAGTVMTGTEDERALLLLFGASTDPLLERAAVLGYTWLALSDSGAPTLSGVGEMYADTEPLRAGTGAPGYAMGAI